MLSPSVRPDKCVSAESNGEEYWNGIILLTIMTTCSRPFARARSPIFSQYLAEECSSPSIMVEPWEKKCTGAILPFFVFPTAILSVVVTLADILRLRRSGSVCAGDDLGLLSRSDMFTREKRTLLDKKHRQKITVSSRQ